MNLLKKKTNRFAVVAGLAGLLLPLASNAQAGSPITLDVCHLVPESGAEAQYQIEVVGSDGSKHALQSAAPTTTKAKSTRAAAAALKPGVRYEIKIRPKKKGVASGKAPAVECVAAGLEVTLADAPEAEPTAEHLFGLMTRNPTAVLELQAHTDHRGYPDRNKKALKKGDSAIHSLAENLIAMGIPAERIKVSKPTPPPAVSAHQKNRRTEFKVLNFDYKPSNRFGVSDSAVAATAKRKKRRRPSSDIIIINIYESDSD